EGSRARVDDARARPGDAQSRGRARAEAGIRPVSASPRSDTAHRRRGRLSGADIVDYLDRPAAFVAATRYENLPAPSTAAAQRVLLDTRGPIVARRRMGEHRDTAA